MNARLVFSVMIYSPENRACDVLPLELATQDQAEQVADVYRVTTHLAAHVVQRTTWEPV